MFLLDTRNISLVMQVAELGRPVSDMEVWERMKRKAEKKADAPDAAADADPEASPRAPPPVEYYGTAGSDLQSYISTFQGFYPHMEDPIREETDETSLIVAGRGRQHGCYRILSAVVQPTTTLTSVRATLTADGPQVPPPRRSRRSTIDVSCSHFHPLSDIRSCMAKLTRFIIRS